MKGTNGSEMEAVGLGDRPIADEAERIRRVIGDLAYLAIVFSDPSGFQVHRMGVSIEQMAWAELWLRHQVFRDRNAISSLPSTSMSCSPIDETIHSRLLAEFQTPGDELAIQPVVIMIFDPNLTFPCVLQTTGNPVRLAGAARWLEVYTSRHLGVEMELDRRRAVAQRAVQE